MLWIGADMCEKMHQRRCCAEKQWTIDHINLFIGGDVRYVHVIMLVCTFFCAPVFASTIMSLSTVNFFDDSHENANVAITTPNNHRKNDKTLDDDKQHCVLRHYRRTNCSADKQIVDNGQHSR
jgi:hypothetical protein